MKCLAEALSYSFWRILSEQHQEIEDVSGSPEVDRDKAIEVEYQGMI